MWHPAHLHYKTNGNLVNDNNVLSLYPSALNEYLLTTEATITPPALC